MNTKTFAQQARNILMKGVANKLLYWGFNEKGEELERPESVSGGYLFRGEVYDDTSVVSKWRRLKGAIKNKGIEEIVEEAAYTWFNRIMAMRILTKNGHDQAQLNYVSEEQKIPFILQRARRGQYAFLPTKDQVRLKRIITDYSKDQAAFGLLLVGYCSTHSLLKQVFGKVDDYTEILLPDDMLAENGFLDLLNTTDAISEEEYQEVELIGRLYQLYISERKDEVFASFKKKKKAEAKDIPAATQIFTPNWIVKYMVENTVGKLWLDLNPTSKVKETMRYLVEGENPTYGDPIIAEVANIKLLDPACGSGHILVEGFDLLYQMYMEEYYPPQEAVESILKNNLFGLDIDDRAMQLARFAVLLKAAKHYPPILKAELLPNIYAMPAPRYFTTHEIQDFLGEDGKDYEEELETALKLMYQAKNLGSTMQLGLSAAAFDYIQHRFEKLEASDSLNLMEQALLAVIRPSIQVLKLLCQKYEAVVANPPYMGSRTMNAKLKDYVNSHYPLSKADLFAVFMEVCLSLNVTKGLMGMINQHSWMFLSSYAKLRTEIVNNYGIVNMLHLGPRTFDELSGEVVQSTAFVLENGNDVERGNYYRLVDYRNSTEKKKAFLKGENFHLNISQENFSEIPGSPIAYWVSESGLSNFRNDLLKDRIKAAVGLNTGKNDYFLKIWYEIDFSKIDFDQIDIERGASSSFKWFPYNKGGSRRKWYGNQIFVLNYENDGKEVKEFAVKRNSGKHWSRYIQNLKYMYQEGITWSDIASKDFVARHTPSGFLFDVKGSSGFPYSKVEIWKILGVMCSKISDYFIKAVNPTITLQVGDLSRVPLPKKIFVKDFEIVDELVKKAVFVSEQDWNSRETSWNFEQLLLLSDSLNLQMDFQSWREQVTQDFFQLHANEEELNRVFIGIYKLEQELTPEVALKDITILQEELDTKALEAIEPTFREQGKEAIELPIKKGVVMQQLISYAVGIFMGRYKLGVDGLHIAHPKPTKEELATYEYNKQSIEIDDDAIVPLMGTACDFSDDAFNRFKDFLDAVWGAETRTENINFLEACLNKNLEQYFIKNFWKDHCKRYKKKPIYWLFTSKKGAFQVLVYMHRMNPFTVEKIRANYLIPHLKTLHTQIDYLEADDANLDKDQAKRLDLLRKQLSECEKYDMELKDVADLQIDFDLDDGVTVNYAKFGTVVAKIK